MLITQALSQVNLRNAMRPATHYLGKDSNYRDLLNSIARLSYLFQKEYGYQKRVAFITSNSPAVIASIFAFVNIRSTIIPIDPSRPPDEIIQWLRDSKATHIAVTSDLTTKVKEILLSVKITLPLIEIEKKHGGEYDTSYSVHIDHQPHENDVILLLRTAGTTGKPRFCQFTHKQLSQAVACLRGVYHFSINDRYLVTMNWSHPFAFMHGMLLPLLSGGTCVIDAGGSLDEFMNFLVNSRVTRLLGTPLFFHRLVTGAISLERQIPAAVKNAIIAGGTLDRLTEDRLLNWKITPAYCYGHTENLWCASLQDTAADRDPQPLDAFQQKTLAGIRYKVLDDQLDEVPGPDFRIGMLAMTGPVVMQGYEGLEKETKNALRGSWFYTGDIVGLEGDSENQYLTYKGRKLDLIRIDGDFVSLSEMNEVVLKIPGISDAACFVDKNSKNEPVIVCAAVKSPGCTINEKQVLEFCKKMIISGEIPNVVVFTDTIPKDMGGNPNYTRLRLQFSGIAG